MVQVNITDSLRNTPASLFQKALHPVHIRADQYGSGNVRVCVIDTGTDYQHPDIIANLWMNPIEVHGPGATAANGYKNGIDDDHNGAPLELT